MTTTRRSNRGPLLILAVGILACAPALTAGCSKNGSAEQLNANSPVSITTRANAITIQNKAGMPLTDVKVMVIAFGSKEYSSSVGRLENDEGRRVSLTDMAAADRSTFNAAFTKPKVVRVRATDAVGKAFELETPWK